MLAASQGVSRSRIGWRHAAWNALVPTITLVGLQVGYLLGGAHHLREGLLLPRSRAAHDRSGQRSRLPRDPGAPAAVRGHVHHRQPGGRPLRDLPRTTTAPTGDQGRRARARSPTCERAAGSACRGGGSSPARRGRPGPRARSGATRRSSSASRLGPARGGDLRPARRAVPPRSPVRRSIARSPRPPSTGWAPTSSAATCSAGCCTGPRTSVLAAAAGRRRGARDRRARSACWPVTSGVGSTTW